MRIAQVAPPYVSVPPKLYGGTELVASLLTEELVKRGYDITLYATGDSITQAKLKSLYPKPLGIFGVGSKRYDPGYDLANINFALKDADQYDIIHSHTGVFGASYARFIETPLVTTLHNDVVTPGTEPFESFKDTCWWVAISKKQMQNLSGLKFAGVVYNAIDTSKYQVEEKKENYLLFFGNICADKGPDVAIEVAKRLGLKLIMSGKIDDGVNREFYESEIKPKIDGKMVEFYPEVDHQTKQDFFGKARAFLFPIRWEEPFGLVMPESMACGTPVIAFPRGSVPEVIVDGETGFLVNNVDEMVEAVKKVDHISPYKCREHAEKYFSVQKNADDYIKIYEKIISEK